MPVPSKAYISEEQILARIIHDGSSRNRQDATRDGHAERRETKAYLKQYVEVMRSEPGRSETAARLVAAASWRLQ